ncbi:MAG: ribosomal protein S18-alanine N-acetyltransferase [Oscillospiraceae bacterium]|nr:ribosomal protein S18-alanine N-acetyltransferase [Oscillospiraceae bacterium]
MDIVRAEEKYIAQIAAVERECFPDPWSEESFRSAMDTQGTVSIAAVDGDDLLGYAVYTEYDGSVYIEKIAVALSHRRKGVGRALLGASEGSETVLEVREGNTSAIEFYKSCGFEQIGTRKGFYSSPAENAAVMRKSVKGSGIC